MHVCRHSPELQRRRLPSSATNRSPWNTAAERKLMAGRTGSNVDGIVCKGASVARSSPADATVFAPPLHGQFGSTPSLPCECSSDGEKENRREYDNSLPRGKPTCGGHFAPHDSEQTCNPYELVSDELSPVPPICCRSFATSPVQPVWWLAPKPKPVSPSKYSLKSA